MRTVCVCCLPDAHAHCVFAGAQMLSALVQSADTEMLQRANGMIESITCKMAVDVENLCKHFTRKEPKKKSVSMRGERLLLVRS